jgi:hypothetical protein
MPFDSRPGETAELYSAPSWSAPAFQQRAYSRPASPPGGVVRLYPSRGRHNAPESVRGMAAAVRVLLVPLILTDVLVTFGWLREFAIAREFRANPGAVSRASAVAADSLVHVTSTLSVLEYGATVVAFLAWFYRVRKNAGAYGILIQRHSQAWSIGAWFCPVVNYWYPYQMTIDILLASEAASGRRLPEKMWATGLLRAWWSAWLLSGALSVAGWITADGSDRTAQMTHVAVRAMQSSADLVAAILTIAVITRISKAQTSRQMGRVSTQPSR